MRWSGNPPPVYLRKTFLFLHLVGGLISALFLILLGISGGLLVFENEIDHWFNSNISWIQPQGTSLSLSELSVRVEHQHAGSKVASFSMPSDERLALTIGLRPVGQGKPIRVAMNQYTGEELGSLDAANQFTRKLHQFHTNLLLGPSGKTITVASAMILCGLSLTGLILWWPRKIWKLSDGSAGSRMNFELHNFVGFYASIVMLLFAVTGIVIHWDNELKQFINHRNHEEDAAVPKRSISSPTSARQSPDELLAVAVQAVPGAKVTSIQGLGGINPIRITMKYPEDRTPAGRTNLYVDPANGALLSLQTSRTAPLGTRIAKLWNREIHTGDIGGWTTRIPACLASFTLPLLAITGPLIWFGRMRRRMQ